MVKKFLSINEVPVEIKEKLSRYVTNVGGNTFVIHGLPSELTGGLLARYSRAQTGLQLTLLNEFLDDNGEPSAQRGSALMDRVLNAFGDDSVGELEGTHVGIEDISQLATKWIEDRRIGGSPIEQSTRYVKYDVKDENGRWRYLRPTEIMQSGLGDKFESVNNRAFDVYQKGVKGLVDHFKQEFPRSKQTLEVDRYETRVKVGEADLINDEERKAFDLAYNFTIRCAALDVGRCVLPSSTLTHIGLFGNGRFYTSLLNFLKSNELEEAQSRASDLELELNKVIPTFIKRNKANPQSAQINTAMKEVASELFRDIVPTGDKVTLLSRSNEYINEVLASALFSYTNVSMPQIMNRLGEISEERKLELLNLYKGKRESRRDRTGRGIEAGYPLTFDLVGGFAEYRDLERHRMLTQQRQDLTTELGFILPPEMSVIGLEGEVNEVVGMMDDLNSDIRHAGLIQAGQYATLFNHRMRFMLGMNLRAFQHLSELRTQPAGHFSYRSMVMEMANAVTELYPWAKTFYNFVDYSDPGNKISRATEQSKISGRNLASGVDASLDI
ncbi:FAD-dependent thymidylate synthase [Candidatus Woesearchaeota archaeon]|nr:MAG: thymidylate synthase complementing protein ThyX [archaeon GW2011_AR18]MBS3161503.1 FAD-dependent thymidylate synthase [Candidatus Woesearchaeota archaeon]HIH25452.1 hypothetical protein [Nanoarchaeota archaeon]